MLEHHGEISAMEYTLDWPAALRTRAVHGGNGIELLTDAPTDNQGRGEFYSPTDLAAVSLASCMMTIIGIRADSRGIEIAGMQCKCEKKMSAQPRRIGRIKVDLIVDLGPDTCSDEDRDWLRAEGLQCPVALSLHPDVDQRVKISFQSAMSTQSS
jgi:uncharacterized OsmC-like protein